MKWWGIWPTLFYLTASPVFALSLDFTNAPVSIDQNQEFSVDINLVCTACNDSYLRGVLYLSGTNYFGFTKNNSGNWINSPGSQALSYFAVLKDEVKEGSWSGKLTIKPDPEDPAFIGPGSYNFKVGRYTSGGSVTWSAPVAIIITGPSPTVIPDTPKPTPKPSPVATLKPTPILPTNKPSPTPTIPIVSKETITYPPIPSLKTQILSVSTSITPDPDISESKPIPGTAIILFVGGLVAIACAFLFDI